MKNDPIETEIVICQCYSPEHQVVITYIPSEGDYDFPTVNIDIHLSQSLNFWKKIGVAIRYIFGHKSNYGAWDNFLLKAEDADIFIKYLQKFKDDTATVSNKK